MTETFHEALIRLGGVRIGDFVLIGRDGQFHLLSDDCGEALRITGTQQTLSLETAALQARHFLAKNPNPRLSYEGPPSSAPL